MRLLGWNPWFGLRSTEPAALPADAMPSMPTLSRLAVKHTATGPGHGSPPCLDTKLCRLLIVNGTQPMSLPASLAPPCA